MNKGEFAQHYSKILSKYSSKAKVIGKDFAFIVQACQQCAQYSTLAGDPNTVLRVGYQKIANGRKVKMFFLHKNGMPDGIPVSKQKVVDALYPPKRRKTTVDNPEKSHRSKVIAAMRNMVAYQLKEFRGMVTYPINCWRSGLIIRKGMKTDVDHIGDPFQKIVDDFFVENNLVFTDITLVGPINNKRFKDEALGASWKAYHKEKAALALVLASHNRAAGAGDYCAREDILGSFTQEGTLSLDF